MSRPSRSPSDALTSAVEEFLAAQPATSGPAGPAAQAGPSRDPGGGSMRSAYDEVLRHEAQKLASPREAPLSLWQRLRGPLLLVLLAGASAYVWLGQPGFLQPPPHSVLPRPRTELSGSRQLVALALQVEDHRHTTGRLPESLESLGLAISHISYTRLRDGEYELRTGTGPHVLVYHGSVGAEAEVKEEVAQ
jgi:hypothetical protein